MAAGHRSPTSHTKPTDRSLEEAQSTGVLDLNGRKLTEIPKTVESYDLSDTVDTNISRNRFNEIPREVCEFTLLEKLDCYNNSIRSLPESLIRLQYLKYLNLSRNQLSHIPSFIGELHCLEVLLISNNRLVSIPEELSQIPSLMHLDVSCNEITALPPQIGLSQNLKILDLRKNLLQELPPEISNLKLKYLDFSNNRIQAIPLELRTMDCLEDLVLNNNPLISPPAHCCMKGRVHIIKLLNQLAMKESKKKGVLAESNFSRTSAVHRSFNRDEPLSADAVRMRRRAVMSTDSGYHTDIQAGRWNHCTTTENGVDNNVMVKSAETIREQRAERHLELQKKISQAELHSPSSRANLNLPTSLTSDGLNDTNQTGGGISPLKFSAGGHAAENSADDMFSKELQRQKHEYEQKKKRAEQLRSEVRRSGKSPTSTDFQHTQHNQPTQPTPSNTSSPSFTASPLTPSPSPSSPPTSSCGKPPHVPQRSSSVNLPSRGLLYSETPTVRPNYLSLTGSMRRQHTRPMCAPASESMHGYSSNSNVATGNYMNYPPPHYTPTTKSRPNKDRGDTTPTPTSDHTPSSSGSGAVPITPSTDQSASSSHRSSPVSTASQEGDARSSSSSTPTNLSHKDRNVSGHIPRSVGAAGSSAVSSRRHARESVADIVQRKLRSRSTPPVRDGHTRSGVTGTSTNSTSDSSRASKSQISSGKAIQAPQQSSYKAQKIHSRSKTAPIPRASGTNIATMAPNNSARSTQSANADSGLPISKLPTKASSGGVSERASRLPSSVSLNTTSSANGQRASAVSSSPSAVSASSKFGFQPSSVAASSRVSPLSTNGKHEHQLNGHATETDEQIISQLKQVIESRLKITLPADVMNELKDGVVLCHLANHVKARTVSQIHVKSSAVPKLSMPKCKMNVDNFLEACRKLGVSQENLCCRADILDDKRPSPVLQTVQSLLDIKSTNSSRPASTNGNNNGHNSSRTNSRSSLSNRSTTPTSSRRAHSTSNNQPYHSFV